MATLGKMFLYILGSVLTYLIGGVVVQVLWGWYVEPLGVSSISLATAMGLSVLVSLMTYPASILVKLTIERDTDTTLETFALIVVQIVMAVTALCAGAIIHLFQ